MLVQKLVVAALSAALCLSFSVAHAGEEQALLRRTVDALRSAAPVRVKRFLGFEHMTPYAVTVHNDAIAGLLKERYTLEDINRLLERTRDERRIQVIDRPWGTFVEAASFESDDMGESTHYDAVWVRDSVWGYLALAAEESTRADAKKVLLTLLDYMASEAQLDRMRRVVSRPAILDGDAGDMNAVHIRFDAQSKDFEDVMEDGQPQPWKHKQNDALGLLMDAALDAYRDGTVTLAELEENKRLVALAGLVAYLDAANFHLMEDSGAWEELARRNTSSIGIVTSALANLVGILESPRGETFAEAFAKAADTFGAPQVANGYTLSRMIFNGYDVVRFQLAHGGESPDYPADDSHYREADAALLNLVYPCRLDRLHVDEKFSALDMVGTLAGDFGICRYLNDDYQSANFWFKGIKTDTDESSYEERRKNFMAGTEAQWFFDSWLANCILYMYEETGQEHLLHAASRHLNRALGQITGSGMISADGRAVKPGMLPESYNFVVSDGEMFAAASPICPLNWAKASLTLALKNYQRILQSENEPETAER